MVLEIMRRRREELGLTCEQLARKIHCGHTSINYIESGKRTGSNSLIRNIAVALGLDYDDIRAEQERNNELAIKKIIAPQESATRSALNISSPNQAPKLKPGRLYKLAEQGFKGERKKLRFLRDEGEHHIFQSPTGGWLESFTDIQLMDWRVTPCGE